MIRLVVSDIFQDDASGNEEGFVGAAEPFLFVLPAAGRRALLSISETLTYDASWVEIVGGLQRRQQLTDRQWAIIEATRDGLLEFEQVNLIVDALNQIKDELAALNESLSGGALSDISSTIALLDPRLAVLLEAVNAVENVLGGTWELPEPEPEE